VAERKEEKMPAANAGPYKQGRAARGRHADSLASAKQLLAAADEPRSGRKDAGGELPAALLGLEKITKLPLTLFFKLLKNFLKNMKISKYKSFKIFQDIQLYQYKLFQNQPRF
jgi:hypothetical protein